MPDFINTEHCVEKLFPVGTTFSFEGKKYQVALCGKPRPARGECKTDVYIKGIASDGEAREIKISVKQKNADFLEIRCLLTGLVKYLGKTLQASLSNVYFLYRILLLPIIWSILRKKVKQEHIQ